MVYIPLEVLFGTTTFTHVSPFLDPVWAMMIVTTLARDLVPVQSPKVASVTLTLTFSLTKTCSYSGVCSKFFFQLSLWKCKCPLNFFCLCRLLQSKRTIISIVGLGGRYIIAAAVIWFIIVRQTHFLHLLLLNSLLGFEICRKTVLPPYRGQISVNLSGKGSTLA